MTPPRLARWLLSIAAPRDERADLLADLAEEAAARESEQGLDAARRWYRAQARHSLGPLLSRRLSRANGPGGLRMGLARDFAFALRSLRASPAFAASVVLMLAIGIGSHLVVYAVVDGLMLRPLPFGDRSERLITLHGTHPTLAQDWNDSEVSYPDLADLRRRSASIERIEGAIGRNVSLSSSQDTERVLGASITPGLFSMLGVAPALGRDFTDSDAADIGFESVLIVSHGLWQSLLGGDPNVVGTPVLMNGRKLTVVGVMPAGFSFPDEHRLWLPYRGHEVNGRANRAVLAIGLVRPGVGIGQAANEVQEIAAALAQEHPATNRDWGLHVMPLREFFVSGSDMATLLTAVTLMLVVVCANLAGLILARGVGRQHELALRAALGAGRFRIVRLLVMETTILACVGGALSLVLAGWGIRALTSWVPERPPYWALPAVDLRVALFAIALTGAVALASGLVPALRISRVDAAGSLLPGARASSGTRSHRRLQQLLVVAQVAVSFALIVGAGLLSRSAASLLQADGGFDLKPLLSFRVYIAGDLYDPPEARGALVSEIVRRLESVPGVKAAAATGSIPTDDGGAAIRLIPPDASATPDREIGAQMTPASPTFWSALGLQLREGRSFTAREVVDPAADVAIVNQRLATLFWGAEGAIGRTLRLAGADEPATVRVIGVAPDLVYEEFGEETSQSQLMVYVPTARAGWRSQAFLVRASSDPAGLSRAIRSEIRQVDPGLAVYDVLTMADRRAYNHWGDQFLGRTSSAFAAVALLLACIGAYGIAAYAVVQRKREIGIRLALGATRGEVQRLFLGLGGRLAAAGALAGVALGILAARALQDDLFRVSPWTAGVWVTPPVVLLLAVLAASYLPARRASRLEPAKVLRAD